MDISPPGPPGPRRGIDTRGVLTAAGAYGLWGLFPLYLAPLAVVGALEVVAHRALWSFLLCAALVLLMGRRREMAALLRDRAALARLALAAVLLSVNWAGYVYAVGTQRTLDAALAYYLNPLLTVVLGVAVLHEQVRRAQWLAVGLGALAVLVLALTAGALPWISLVIALSWSIYGLVKKGVGPRVSPVAGMTVETAVLLPLALGMLLTMHRAGEGAFLGAPVPGAPAPTLLALMLVGTGAVTTAPLLLFAAASRRLPLVVLGLLQFATPTLQFLVAVVAFGEPMPAGRWVGFAIAWAAMAVLGLDIIRQVRRSPRR